MLRYSHQSTKQLLSWNVIIKLYKIGSSYKFKLVTYEQSVSSNKNLLLFPVTEGQAFLFYVCVWHKHPLSRGEERENELADLSRTLSKINKKRKRHTWNKSHWQKAINETLKGPCWSSMCVACLALWCGIQQDGHRPHRSCLSTAPSNPIIITEPVRHSTARCHFYCVLTFTSSERSIIRDNGVMWPWSQINKGYGFPECTAAWINYVFAGLSFCCLLTLFTPMLFFPSLLSS